MKFQEYLLEAVDASMNKYVLQKLVDTFAAIQHENWRLGLAPGSQKIKKFTDGTSGDINVKYDKLHQDYKTENQLAAKAALKAVNKYNTVEGASSFIHDEWMKRNIKNKYDGNANLFVSYKKLPEEEKQKDREHLFTMLALLNNEQYSSIAPKNFETLKGKLLSNKYYLSFVNKVKKSRNQKLKILVNNFLTTIKEEGEDMKFSEFLKNALNESSQHTWDVFITDYPIVGKVNVFVSDVFGTFSKNSSKIEIANRIKKVGGMSNANKLQDFSDKFERLMLDKDSDYDVLELSAKKLIAFLKEKGISESDLSD